MLRTGIVGCKENALCYNSDIVHPYKPKQAFTLAEVLVTLGIIGIVAVMTLPNLVGQYQKSGRLKN